MRGTTDGAATGPTAPARQPNLLRRGACRGDRCVLVFGLEAGEVRELRKAGGDHDVPVPSDDGFLLRALGAGPRPGRFEALGGGRRFEAGAKDVGDRLAGGEEGDPV